MKFFAMLSFPYQPPPSVSNQGSPILVPWVILEAASNKILDPAYIPLNNPNLAKGDYTILTNGIQES